MKKTAVEWYNLKVIELMTQREQGNIDVLEFRNQLDLLLTQAKEMEKQQQGYSEKEVIEIIKLSCEEGMLIQRTINDKVKIPYMRIKDFTIRMFEQYKKK
jgi:hypothetical protein